MKASLQRLLTTLLFLVFSSVLFAQEKTQAYYNTHESEIIPDARTAFTKGDYERTVELCKWHYIIVGNHDADELREKAERCMRLSKEIQSLQDNGQFEKALEWVSSLQQINPDDPLARRLLNKTAMEAQNQPDPVGYIKVTSEPSGAAIWLDGKDTGLTTPDILEDVSPGNHDVNLVLDGYAEYRSTVSVSSGQRANLSSTLSREVPETSVSVSSVPTKGNSGGYDWVDLGLSVKWATCNVGATSPEDSGVHYSWGEIHPKKVYDWSKYRFGRKNTGDSFSKYVTNPDFGTVDNKTQLDYSDDAACRNWGGSWRMPTLAEQEELIEFCNWTWTRQKGQDGYLVTSKINGNSIFLPAAGCRYNTGIYQKGTHGLYWSSTLNTGFPFMATGLYFSSDNVECYSNYRVYGRSIRPVLD